jgi:asparagine synthase (glutamine-hydrolysing)
MSVLFGRWNLDGKPVDMDYLEKVKPVIAPYGPDDGCSYARTSISILYRAFHTTIESRHEIQPHVTHSGAVITWDGRLDNRAELISQLRNALATYSTDVSIVAAAYEEWGTDCFAKLIGDWALSIWDANSSLLILAKDPIGTRHLYYSIDRDQVTWSTVLDPLVLFAGHSFALNEEYIAGWFSFFPAAHLTPYVGIHSVPPSCSVSIRAGKHTSSKYWDFDPAKRIRYRTDTEYEEHFRAVFAEAVRRRLRSDSPILAELSGGMDSSSIVCMADTVVARGFAETPRLDTISYYNDSEPNWNERPYFTRVEEKRGRTGCHINVGSQKRFNFQIERDQFASTPGSGATRLSETGKRFIDCMISQGNRVVLSGIGGDEVTGGVPTPTAEFENLLARAKFRILAHQLIVWALNKRKPWFYLLFEAVRTFLPTALVGVPEYKRPAPWLNSDFVKRNRRAFRGYQTRVRLFGPLPSFQDNLSTLDGMRRQLACAALSSDFPYEKRYPFLDQQLLEFLYAIPREQLVRPGQRRSLLRRALVGLVPDELLNRKRKAFVSRAPMTSISTEWASITELSHHMATSSLGVVDTGSFLQVLQKARQGMEVPLITVTRTVGFELWLRHIRDNGIFCGCKSTTSQSTSHFATRGRRRTRAHPKVC